MKDLFHARPDTTFELIRHMAIYFAQFHIRAESSNPYRDLFEKLRQIFDGSEIKVASLNYELLLELSISQAGFRVAYERVTDCDDIEILKLHGSCNFLQQIAFAAPDVLSMQSPMASIELPIEYAVRRNDVVEYCLNQGFPPAMCLYMEGKPTQISPNFIADLHRKWTETAIGADTIVVVGVHPEPADVHVWQPLEESEAIICYVGPEEEKFRQWSTGCGKERRSKYIGPYFSESIDEIIRLMRDT